MPIEPIDHTDRITKHADVTTTPHTDKVKVPHADTPPVHNDVPRVHTDEPGIHIDVNPVKTPE
jgi:hypothetical protein